MHASTSSFIKTSSWRFILSCELEKDQIESGANARKT